MKQFTANRLAGGNRLFPAEISIDNFGVNLKIPGLFSGKQKSLSFDKISSVRVDSPMIGFSKITFDTIGWDYIVAEGFEKADAEEIKELVQIGIQAVRHGGGGNGGGANLSQHIAQSEAARAQAEAAKAQADIEKRKLDLEEAKHRQEVEEKEAARRKARADEYRKQGKNTLAFFVEMNPVYLIGIIVLVIGFAVLGYKKYEQHSRHAELMAELNSFQNQASTSQSNSTVQPTISNAPTTNTSANKVDTAVAAPATTAPAQPEQSVTQQQNTAQQQAPPQANTTNANTATITADKSYFFDNADINTRRKGYLLKGQKVAITNEQGDFFAITFTAENGMKTDAWMLKSELQKD